MEFRRVLFRSDPTVGRRSSGLEERLRHVVGDQLGLGVDQEVFLFDSEGECVGHSSPLLDRLASWSNRIDPDTDRVSAKRNGDADGTTLTKPADNARPGTSVPGP